jgi:hypothetical protein
MSDEPIRVNSQEVVWKEIGDDIVVLHMSTATYLTINGSGRVLWKLLVDGATRGSLAEALIATYSIEADRAAEDVDAYLSSLAECSLLENRP